MILTAEEQSMLEGSHGRATRKAMEILVTLGTIFGAQTMYLITSAQIAGVSYDNLGDAGLQFLTEMVEGGGRARVLTTLNPAGMDVGNWQRLGISPEFAENQQRVVDAYGRMNVITTCTCTPYLAGNLPHYGEHIAWAESSAVCFANSVIGARTNREGGPSALAAAIAGRTPAYGYHLDQNRLANVTVEIEKDLACELNREESTALFGAMGKALGEKLETSGGKTIPYLRGLQHASLESLKSFCASLATYGGVALFHMEGITPEATQIEPPTECIFLNLSDISSAIQSLNDDNPNDVDFVSLGCPHLSIKEIAHLAELLEGKKVVKEFWITTARPTKQIADRMGYSQIIEDSGAKFAVDTCCVVAPIKNRFSVLATDSAKACYYAYAKNKFKTVFLSFDDVVSQALGE